MNLKLKYALSYAQIGWSVLPVTWITDEKKCSCGGRPNCAAGKHPLTKNGVKDATTDINIIKRWFTKWPEANIGVATGAVSGILVIDIDPKNSGDVSEDELSAKGFCFPRGIMQMSGGGGWHYVVQYPGGNVGRNATNLWPGIDLRGDGGYFVVEPSIHQSGNAYFWDDEGHPLGGALE